MNNRTIILLVALFVFLIMWRKRLSASENVTTITDNATGKKVVINADLNSQEVQDALNILARIPADQIGDVVTINVQPGPSGVNITSITGIERDPVMPEEIHLLPPEEPTPSEVVGEVISDMPFECLSYLGMTGTYGYPNCPSLDELLNPGQDEPLEAN